ncbi:MAG: amino acid permease, partial [Verrucomicrobia bacterium]|nr:amino acid permease [Verrucomicrobiota bacterium]
MSVPAPHEPHLQRRFGLLQATALNMTNMIGMGPFITIPLLMSALGGPQAMLGWLLAMLIVIPDGMVWAELGAAMPGSGGSYHYLREAYGHQTWGRFMAFLFIWQFVLSGPMEIATAYIGFAQYAGYVLPGMSDFDRYAMSIAIGAFAILLLYRQITSVAKITVSLWIGVLVTVGAVIATGALHFNPKIAFDFPPGAFNLSLGFFIGLGAAARIGIYDYLGYYDVCYIGDEVQHPGKTIPRSVLVSVIGVAIIYVAMNLSIIGVVPWREFVPTEQHKEVADNIVSIFMERLHGRGVAVVFTFLVLWTTLGSVFALLLGYSRIPYAAAREGYFFSVFSRLHPTRNFPHVSLLVVGVLSIAASFFPLDAVIDALLATRLLIQFVGQVCGVMLLRRRAPKLERPYRIWLYPLPCLVALAGWLFLFATSGGKVIAFGLATLAVGVVV